MYLNEMWTIVIMKRTMEILEAMTKEIVIVIVKKYK